MFAASPTSRPRAARALQVPSWRLALPLAVLPLVLGCEDGGAPSEPKAAEPAVLRTKQENLQDWAAEVKNSAGLQKVLGELGNVQQQGLAGVIEDASGRRLVWAEYAPKADAPRTEVMGVWQVCDKAGKCTAGKANYTATGAELTDSEGKAVTSLAIGAPVLRKNLLNHNTTEAATVLAPLERSFKVDAVIARNRLELSSYKKRKAVILNAYGPQVGLDATPVRKAAEATGLFDSVEVVDFMRRSDLEAVLPILTPLDVVVWIGAGVQETFTDKPVKSMGMTVSRGVVGDQLYHKAFLEKLLAAPPLGGPGLVVLAGASSVSPEYALDKNTLSYHLNLAPTRAVVGFGAKVTAAEALSQTAALLTELAKGKDLGAAMTATGKWVSPLEKATAAKWKLPGKAAAFWGKPPSKAELTLYVKVDPECTDAATTCDPAGYAEGVAKSKVAATKLTAGSAKFECDLTFAGPYFECAADEAVTSTKFALKGVMGGRQAGDRFWLYVEGSTSPLYKDIALIGEGVIAKVDPYGGGSTLFFDGTAAASPYRDADGNCCVAKMPLLQSIDAKQGQIKLYN